MNIELFKVHKEEIISPILGSIQAILINIVIYYISNNLGMVPRNVLLTGNIPFSITHIIYTEIFLGLLSSGVLIYLNLNQKRNITSYFGYFCIGMIAFCSVLPTLITFAPIQLIISIEIMNIISAICIYSSVSRRIFNK